MASAAASSFCFLGFLLCLIFCSNPAEGKTWCVAQTHAPPARLQGFLDSVCGRLINCQEIQPGGKCYEPNTLPNHASYALDLYYRKYGVCDTSFATPTITDPSFRECVYP